MGPFIADFYCAETSVVIELDGDTHAAKLEYDSARDRWLTKNGYCVIRFMNHSVHHDLEAVLLTILRECDDRFRESVIAGRKNPSPPAPLPEYRGEGRNYAPRR